MTKPTTVACNLPIEALDTRINTVINDLFAHTTKIDELADGYEFFFDSDAKWIARLAQFIHTERTCCGFLLFELVVRPLRHAQGEANPGSISLKLRGDDGVKSFIQQFVPS